MPPGDTVFYIVRFVATLQGEVEAFDRDTYKHNLAEALGGIAAANVALSVRAGSVHVEAAITTYDLAVAASALSKLRNYSPAALSRVLGVSVETIAAPTLEDVYVRMPRLPPMPPLPPSCVLSCEIQKVLITAVPLLLVLLPVLVCAFVCGYFCSPHQQPGAALATTRPATKAREGSSVRPPLQERFRWRRARARTADQTAEDLFEVIPPIDTSVDMVKAFRSIHDDAIASVEAAAAAVTEAKETAEWRAQMIAKTIEALPARSPQAKSRCQTPLPTAATAVTEEERDVAGGASGATEELGMVVVDHQPHQEGSLAPLGGGSPEIKLAEIKLAEVRATKSCERQVRKQDAMTPARRHRAPQVSASPSAMAPAMWTSPAHSTMESSQLESMLHGIFVELPSAASKPLAEVKAPPAVRFRTSPAASDGTVGLKSRPPKLSRAPPQNAGAAGADTLSHRSEGNDDSFRAELARRCQGISALVGEHRRETSNVRRAERHPRQIGGARHGAEREQLEPGLDNRRRQTHVSA